MLPFEGEYEFDTSRDEEFFAALPARAGVFLLEMKNASAQPYLARTADIRRAAERLLRPPDALSKRLILREVAARIRFRCTGSKFEQSLVFYEQAQNYFPNRYRDLMRLRPPALLKVNLRNEYPRCYVTRQIRGDEGFYFGPFMSRRAADEFSEGFLDLFKTRRCQIKIRRDPSFPGCVYSEMKMCLAPCFAGCSKEEYDRETGRMVEALASAGAALTEQIEQEREAASEALDFERAAALHKRLEKAAGVLRGLPEIARRVESLDLVILQRAAQEKIVVAFPVLSGALAEPIFLRFDETSEQPRSMETFLRNELEEQMAKRASEFPVQQAMDERPGKVVGLDLPSVTDLNWQRSRYGLRTVPPRLTEHLSLISRWFYSNPRQGEIFYREAEWPYRRILRACARLLAPPTILPLSKPPSPQSPN